MVNIKMPRGGGSPGRSIDRYLHALLLLTDHGQQADTGDVATRVGVSDAAASRMMRTLERKKLVRLEPYQGAALTPKGLHHALRVVRRHRLLEVYLHTVMGFDLKESHERAMCMGPTIDEVFEEKLDNMLGCPKVDPHGQPIPTREATWPRLSDAPLLELPAGISGRVSRVMSEDGEAIKYLDGQGIRPGASIVLESIAPFDGPVAVRLADRLLHLGRRLARLINVEKSDEKLSAQTSKRGGPGKRKPSQKSDPKSAVAHQ